MNQEWSTVPTLKDFPGSNTQILVFEVNEGDSDEGTWSTIALFYYQHDADLFVKAKQEDQRHFNEVQKRALKRQGKALKRLADL